MDYDMARQALEIRIARKAGKVTRSLTELAADLNTAPGAITQTVNRAYEKYCKAIGVTDDQVLKFVRQELKLEAEAAAIAEREAKRAAKLLEEGEKIST